MTLLNLKNGQSARVIDINKKAHCYDRLLELGFTQGEEIKVLRRAPLNGPLQVEVRNSYFAIRPSDAKHIRVTT